jgi:hypothetical protein
VVYAVYKSRSCGSLPLSKLDEELFVLDEVIDFSVAFERGEAEMDEIPGTFNDWREARRSRAWELKQKGWEQCDIAEALGVTDGAVSQWVKRVREGDWKPCLAAGGPKPKINEEELQWIS